MNAILKDVFPFDPVFAEETSTFLRSNKDLLKTIWQTISKILETEKSSIGYIQNPEALLDIIDHGKNIEPKKRKFAFFILFILNFRLVGYGSC